MNDDKDIREPKAASQTNPLELPFTFTVPRQLLPTACNCPVHNNQHLDLPPSMGSWGRSDDMSADMYHHSKFMLTARSKIEYQVRVKIVTRVDRKATVTAETVEPIQILPVYSWWRSCRSQIPSQSSPSYEYFESPISELTKTIEVEKKIKKGIFGKKKGTVSISIETADSYHINIGQSEESTNSLSMPIKMRYSPISADLPPCVTSLSARLHARTSFNVDGRKDPRNAGSYNTSVTILKTSTPSTSTPLWLEDSTSSQLSFVSNLLVPMNLPVAAGSTMTKGEKVLLPSFDSCLSSRSYEVEVRIGFDGGSEAVLRIPTAIVAKPATSAAEAAFDNAVRVGDNWTPSGQGVVAGEVEPELMRPTPFNLNITDADSSNSSDANLVADTSLGQRSLGQITDLTSNTPPDYAVVIETINKQVLEHRVTAVAA